MQTSKQYRRFSYVHLNDFADSADFDLDRRASYLGPQPQLGLWSERRLGVGGGHSDRAVVDGSAIDFQAIVGGQILLLI